MLRCPSCTSEIPVASRYCSDCGAAVPTTGESPTQTSVPAGEAASAGPPRHGATTFGAGRIALDTSDDRRFVPGAMVADRYRIVGLLGVGGMGEVYRAEDLKLAQPVALKFLPESLQDDAGRLGRFLNEVRVARQVSHPNVCRVYDVGEVAGHHYLSMEYVDGEDLASLLRRIGRLPADKAVQIARQVSAGLAAAHAKGIVHRDLKPANVMVDGEGQVRVTDFGLAGLAEGFQGAEIRVGTPAYMAPEQLSGKEVTPRSDLYALGLVLYELFTGKQAYDAGSLDELKRRQQESAPTHPSTLIPDLDPAVERVILRCLERDPTNRPDSALSVSAALPGGDPLAAALAAGETPSPEMVAAAGPDGGMGIGPALLGLGAVLIGVLLVTWLSGIGTLYGRVPMNRPAAAVANDAQQILRDLGYEAPASDTACSFQRHRPALQYFAERDRTASRWDPLSKPGQIGLFMFYRQSEEPLIPRNLIGRVTREDPAPADGDIALTIGLEGRLLRLDATPAFVNHEPGPAVKPDWSPLFAAAGLDMSQFEPIPPTIQPRMFGDTRAAWKGVLPHRDDLPVRVEATALAGRPVFFETVTPYDTYWSAETAEARKTPPAVNALGTAFVVFGMLIFAGVVWLSLRNWKRGRGDTRGALRLALYVLVARMLYWVFTGHHAADVVGEIFLFIVAVGPSLLSAVLTWMLYMGLEPYARRLWPEALVSWSRLLAGRIRDPLVGRDLLIGFVFAVGLLLIEQMRVLAPVWLGLPPPAPLPWGLDALNGGRWAFGQLFLVQLTSLFVPLGHFVFFLLLRIVLRRQWIAAVAYCAILALGSVLGNAQAVSGAGQQPSPALIAFLALVGAGTGIILIALLVRFGLLAASACFLLANLMAQFPITLDPSAPYFAIGVIPLMLVVALAVFAFYNALAGRRIFQDLLVEEPAGKI